MLNRCSGHLYTFTAKDTIKEKNTKLSNITMPDQYKKTGRLVKTLWIKLGAQVMLTNNIDVTYGLTNHALSTITCVVSCEGSTAMLVKFHNTCVGQAAKENSKYKHITKFNIPIKCYQPSFQIHGKKSTEASWTQFPLILSWVITIHKVQGLTLGAVVVDMAKSKGDYQ